MRAAIRLAGGREVCFVCTRRRRGRRAHARASSRAATCESVLALPGFARARRDARAQPSVGAARAVGRRPTTSPRACTTTASDSASSTTTRRELYVVVEVPRDGVADTPLDPTAIDADLGPDGPIATQLRALRGPRQPARDGGDDRAALQRRRRRAARGGHRASASRSAISSRRCAGRRRTASARSCRRTRSTCRSSSSARICRFSRDALDRPEGALRAAQGMAQLSLPDAARAGRGRRRALFDDGRPTSSTTIVAWAERTTDGSLSDLPTPPRAEVWDEVSAEPDLCTRVKCALFEKCFLFKARREAAQADVIVVNHHLLLSDLAVRRASQNWEDAAVLPAYARLVVDEGHHLEDAAAAHLGATVTRRALQRLFARLDRRGRASAGAHGAARGGEGSAQHGEPRSRATKPRRRRCARAREVRARVRPARDAARRERAAGAATHR